MIVMIAAMASMALTFALLVIKMLIDELAEKGIIPSWVGPLVLIIVILSTTVSVYKIIIAPRFKSIMGPSANEKSDEEADENKY